MHRPTGTVTFLFTDIEGSTRRWEDDADAMRVALAAHDEVLRAAIETSGGWLFKHTGDGVCAAFASARAAVDAAVAAQRLLELPVRMGIATGEAEQRGEDYFGPALNRVARVMAVGDGGQVLVSNATAALAAGVDLLVPEFPDRHAHYDAADAVAHWDIWDGPHQRVATDWVDVEFANLRAGFRWAFDRHDLDTATAIAAHTTMLAANLLRFEPVGWANELLTAVGIADIRQFPRVCAAAAYCTFTGSPATGVVHAEKALASESDLRFQPFEAGLSTFLEAAGHIYSGRIDRWLEVWTALEASSSVAICMRLCGLTWGLPVVGRGAEALADKTLASARVHANPWLTAFALHSCGRALATTDPVQAQEAYSEGLAVSREHRIPFWEAALAQDAAGLEADQGDQDQSLALFDVAIDSFQQAGAIGDLAGALANLAIYLDRTDRAEVASTLIGTITGHASVIMAVGLANSVEHLRTALGTAQFEECVATGAAMELANAARYARVRIQLLRSELAGST